jgi:hypothetical protein
VSNGAFSLTTRQAFIDHHFGGRSVTPSSAWKDIYRLLLWVDPTTGLAHCYESDKAQPGRHWYERSLAFHAWVSEQLGVDPLDLVDEIDGMFRNSLGLVVQEQERVLAAQEAKAARQREKFARDMPLPDEDPQLLALLDPLFPGEHPRPDDDQVRAVLRAVRRQITAENKRKNLLGRGFEDALVAVIRRIDTAGSLKVGTQTPIQEIDGFRKPRSGDKDEKVDLYVLAPNGRRILVSAKWSVRADREKQMRGDFSTYINCNDRAGDSFEYVWVTNEFDPARLTKNANHIESNSNQRMLDKVVHVCPEALWIVHDLKRTALPDTLPVLKNMLETGRIIGLEQWLAELQT